ncbi:hypothetical protein QBC40DRAFT_250910 [Triangularia verruculosa]|uniref:Uncharacterized protein n=1 Tax=Triangularia verruculosa TaxID=2587418 RepID=A0AAN6XU69_9PEZI|nr:hypothetical protein QBC40DRAFT_250910 [Triangularia verruculosa]
MLHGAAKAGQRQTGEEGEERMRSMPDNRSDQEILGEEYRVEVDTDDAED